jgi:hypothetical protein
MTERIDSRQVLDKGAVGDVRRETKIEHFLRVCGPIASSLVDYIFLGVILAGCWYLVLWGDDHSAGFRNGAWSLISGIAGAIGTRLWGSSKKARK